MKSMYQKSSLWVVLSLVLAGVLALPAACTDESDGIDNLDNNNGNIDDDDDDDPVCPAACPQGTVQVVDSATRCGFRCDVVIEDRPDVDPNCDRQCEEGFELVLAPQTECGFTCLPVRVEDGSSFDNDVDLNDLGNNDVEEDEEVEADVPEEEDAVEDTEADIVEDVEADGGE